MVIFHTLLPEGHDESSGAKKLLQYLYYKRFSRPMPEMLRSPEGKPFFAEASAHFSLSHSRGHVLVALGAEPVGVDIEVNRELRESFTGRLFSPAMQSQFAPLEGWTLRESVYKLTGRGSLREMEFSREGERIMAPFEGVSCRIYHGDGYTAAAAAFSPLPEICEITWEEIKNS